MFDLWSCLLKWIKKKGLTKNFWHQQRGFLTENFIEEETTRARGSTTQKTISQYIYIKNQCFQAKLLMFDLFFLSKFIPKFWYLVAA